METEKLQKFLRQMRRKQKDKGLPATAFLELTYACNHQCVHCYNPPIADKKELTMQEVMVLIDQMNDMGVLQVTLSGGEIFMRRDIMEIIRYLRKQGMHVTIKTNGTLITDEQADELITLGVTRFEISFLGATKETFDAITQVEGSFDRACRVIEMLRSKGIIPFLRTCVIQQNAEDVEQLKQLAKEMDVSFSYSPSVIPRLDCDQTPGKMRLSPGEFLDMRGEMKPSKNKPTPEQIERRRRRVERPGFWERDKVFNCAAGHSSLFINPYGEMKVCLTLPEPSFNLRQVSIKDAWGEVKKFAVDLKPPKDWECLTCDVNIWCSWCPARGYLNTGKIFGCPPYFKELASERQRRFEENRARRMKEKEKF